MMRRTLDRLLREVVLPFLVQGVHSGTTIGVTLYVMHFALPSDFASATAYFLIATIVGALLTQWIGFLQLRGTVTVRQLVAIVLSVGALSLVVLGVYFLWADLSLGPAYALAPLSLVSLYSYYALRRVAMIAGRPRRVLVAESMRLVVTVGVMAMFKKPTFSTYLLWMGVAHLIPLSMLIGPVLNARASQRSESIFLTRQELGNVLASLASTLSGQLTVLLAPIYVGIDAFSSVRAYEIFAFVAIFAIQALDPIFLRRSVDWRLIRGNRQLLRELVWPVCVLLLPLLALAALEAIGVKFLSPVHLVIPAPYVQDSHLFWAVIGASILVCLSAPIRWYLTLQPVGVKMLCITIGTAFVSQLLLLLVPRSVLSGADLILAAKIFYEAALLLGLALLFVSQRRIQSPRNDARINGLLDA